MNLWVTIHKWHRRIGIVAALFVIMLVVTGIMLNHTGSLALDKSYVKNNLLLDFYDINPAAAPFGFRVGDHWISQVGERVYFDRRELRDNVEQLIGAVTLEDDIIVGFDGRLLLLTGDGEVIERLTGTQGVPAGMRAIGKTVDEQLVIRGAHGDYQVNLDSLDWHEEDFIHAIWKDRESLPAGLQGELLQQYRGTGLPLERVMLDLHSGRIAGNWGVYVVDAAAILFFILALSGIWMWYQRR